MSYQIDHRRLADEMEIYVLDEEIGAGLPVWLPNGVAIRDALEAMVKELEHRGGYQRVVSPHLAREELYSKSGHLSCFAENMFPPIHWKEDKKNYYLKPMNCPHHHRIFSSKPRSYRQLPLRLAEYGQVYRYEPSGSLRGLSRVRGLCQNDAHIYVEKSQAADELRKVLDLHEKCYRNLGLKGYRFRLSCRDPQRRADFPGADADWDQAELLLRVVLEERGVPYELAIGEAAFYGPKIDVQMKMLSSQAGEESIASIQLDILSAERFGLSYIASSGSGERPWIIHRAPLGSHERFVALLLEYFDGQFPGWLAPVQVIILPVGPDHLSFSRNIHEQLLAAGIRAKLDENQGSLAKRLKQAHLERPFAKIVVGQQEIVSGILNMECRSDRVSGDIHRVIHRLKEACLVPR